MHCKDAPRYVSRKFHKSLAKQFLEVAINNFHKSSSEKVGLKPPFIITILSLSRQYIVFLFVVYCEKNGHNTPQMCSI